MTKVMISNPANLNPCMKRMDVLEKYQSLRERMPVTVVVFFRKYTYFLRHKFVNLHFLSYYSDKVPLSALRPVILLVGWFHC